VYTRVTQPFIGRELLVAARARVPHVVEDGEEDALEDALPEGGGERGAALVQKVEEDLYRETRTFRNY
jgi:hypothetical protein